MKAEILGYITGITNNHIRVVESLKKYGHRNDHVQMHENCINELSDLLEYVVKAPVENKEIIRFTADIVLENQKFQKRVAELEESCENMNEVEKNNHITISELESANIRYRGQLLENDKKISQLEEVNSGVWEENRRIKLLNKKSFRKIKILKSKLKNKLKGER